jgi:hypothetical protein
MVYCVGGSDHARRADYRTHSVYWRALHPVRHRSQRRDLHGFGRPPSRLRPLVLRTGDNRCPRLARYRGWLGGRVRPVCHRYQW